MTRRGLTTVEIGASGYELVGVGRTLLILLGLIAAALLLNHWLRGVARRVLLPSTVPPPAQMAVINATTAFVWIVAVTVFLAFNGASWAAFASALGIGTLAAAFGLQDVLRSFVGGILVLFERPFAVGDRVRINRIEGEVITVRLRSMLIRTNEGHLAQLPNSMLFSEVIENLSQTHRFVRLILIDGIPESPVNARRTIEGLLSDLPTLEPPPELTARPELPRLHDATRIMSGPQRASASISFQFTSDESAHDKLVETIANRYPEARITVRLV